MIPGFAEITLGPEQIVGGGLGGTLVVLATLIARRTKDTDELRERLTKMALDHALEREGQAQEDIDGAKAEARRERQAADQLRIENTALRETNAELKVRYEELEHERDRTGRRPVAG